jgi:nickel-dependent lactate racemase
MRIELPYADRTIAAELPAGAAVHRLDIRDVPALADVAESVVRGLGDPIGFDRPFLHDFHKGETVCIVVPDSFRHAAIDRVLPPLLHAINVRGIGDGYISFLFATGVHRAPTTEEQRTILGAEAFGRCRDRLVSHDPYDDAHAVRVGKTRRGTEVFINKLVCESTHVIATGSVVLHYFGGFGGGRKTLVPGVASARTIAHNHALNLHPTEDRLDPSVRIGVMAGNPVAEDMLEAARFVPIDGIVNTVLNRGGEIVDVYIGELEAAHAAACERARGMFTAELDEPADVVIAASAHTRNFVQTHKALYNAASAAKPDGRIVLAAPCREGLGGETFTKWLNLGTAEAVIRELRRNSEINGQTALSTLEKARRTHFVTELSEADVAKLGGTKCASLQDAVDRALAEANLNGSAPRIAVMPSAAYTVPVIPNPRHSRESGNLQPERRRV